MTRTVKAIMEEKSHVNRNSIKKLGSYIPRRNWMGRCTKYILVLHRRQCQGLFAIINITFCNVNREILYIHPYSVVCTLSYTIRSDSHRSLQHFIFTTLLNGGYTTLHKLIQKLRSILWRHQASS